MHCYVTIIIINPRHKLAENHGTSLCINGKVYAKLVVNILMRHTEVFSQSVKHACIELMRTVCSTAEYTITHMCAYKHTHSHKHLHSLIQSSVGIQCSESTADSACSGPAAEELVPGREGGLGETWCSLVPHCVRSFILCFYDIRSMHTSIYTIGCCMYWVYSGNSLIANLWVYPVHD